ncbi:hypothetical protein RRG08_023662 [Elysia crispata]|uniref:Uncharacterized protein n=1 Tax=Elysia crispata TaxID=231223 RepID=A0AAE0XSS4_9GAST|nr:hypothetical protein RRG08_023662 [Elysia crispata]
MTAGARLNFNGMSKASDVHSRGAKVRERCAFFTALRPLSLSESPIDRQESGAKTRQHKTFRLLSHDKHRKLSISEVMGATDVVADQAWWGTRAGQVSARQRPMRCGTSRQFAAGPFRGSRRKATVLGTIAFKQVDRARRSGK